MLIRYKGGRSRYEVALNRKPYYFVPENNKTLDIKEQAVVNYIFSLPNREEFEAVEPTPIIHPQEKADIEAPVINKLECKVCGFISKSEQGLIIHSIKHKKNK